MKTQAILTLDLEFWYNSKFLENTKNQASEKVNDYTKEIIDRLLTILKSTNQQATFFVLGELAFKYPEIIKEIANQGHKIASHGYSHKTLNDLNPESFEQELKQGKEVLEKIINQKITGFRTPNFSLNQGTTWALEILKINGFKYDASFHPLKIKKLNRKIKLPGDFQEVNTSLGGIYFRILPLWLYCWLIKTIFKNQIPVLYFHPHELFDFVPQIKTGPWLKLIIKYWGTKSAEKKFIKLMNRFQFISIEQYLYDKLYY